MNLKIIESAVLKLELAINYTEDGAFLSAIEQAKEGLKILTAAAAERWPEFIKAERERESKERLKSDPAASIFPYKLSEQKEGAGKK